MQSILYVMLLVVSVLPPGSHSAYPNSDRKLNGADLICPEVNTKNDISQLASAAMNRQCGSCHQGTHSTNTAALAIYNLADSCWYCKITSPHVKSLLGRIQGKSFSNEEREAITSLLQNIADSKL